MSSVPANPSRSRSSAFPGRWPPLHGCGTLAPAMVDAFLWGLVAASSLVLGGLLGSWVELGRRTLGATMAFGAGVLLSAVAYELVFEGIQLGKTTGYPSLGFFTGAFTFLFFDRLIERIGAFFPALFSRQGWGCIAFR